MNILITGISGQDGSYMADLLLEKGHKVYGLIRRKSNENFENIEHLLDKVTLIPGDLSDQSSLMNAINISKPDQIYNFAAQSFVGASWEQPELTSNITGLGALRLLEAIRKINSKIKFVQASSSEQFGRVLTPVQDENTPFNPVSPYGSSKVFAYFLARTYRYSYGMFASNAISFNHEGPRRGKEFVTRKISMGVAKIHLGLEKKITLGNLDAKRDWSHAKDIVNGIYLIMQHNKPDDFVLCSGKTHSVRDFLREAFKVIGVTEWWDYVDMDQQLIRPAEVDELVGDYSKIRDTLGWQPKIGFDELVREMVESDIKLFEKEK